MVKDDVIQFIESLKNNENIIRYLCDMDWLEKNKGKQVTTRKKCDIIKDLDEGKRGEKPLDPFRDYFNNSLDLEQLKKLLAFYVLMKQMRNNTNHGGGGNGEVNAEAEAKRKVYEDLKRIIEA